MLFHILRIYCILCRRAKHENLLVSTQTSAFVDEGFCNWCKALQRFSQHEKSEIHKQATEILAARDSGIDIAFQLSAQHSSDIKYHQKMLLKVLSSVRYLARQGLALRGHDETKASFEGNLYQLLFLQSNDCQGMQAWLHKREYISPEIINEIISIMGQSVLREILSEIKSSLWFSVIADEATDICNNEQMSISICYVDAGYDIHEDTIGLIKLPNTTAQTLFTVMKNILLCCSLPIAQCIGQAYDGAANMSGIQNGVQALIKKECNRALYVHCFAHSLNLCLQSVTKQCEVIFELVQLIIFSPKQLSLFERIQKDIAVNSVDLPTPCLRNLCPTRWTVRHASINSVLLNYKVLQEKLHEVQMGTDDYAAKARGILTRMETFEIYFGFNVAYLIFAASEQLSVNIQGVKITIQEAVHGATMLVSRLKSLGNESEFNGFYDKF